MRTRTMLAALAVVTVLVLVLVLAPVLRGPERSPIPAYWPTQGWRSSTPEEQGIDSARLADALLAIREKQIPVHSLLLVRNGVAVVDAYFYPYDGTTVHDLASVTKSVMTTLIGIAADQGKLNLDQPLVSFFSDRPIANRDARKNRITVRHLVSMSSGLDCTREVNEATLREMQASADWVQFTLDRKARWEPGSHFVYCSPGMHLLSAILQQSTGMTTLEFARKNLFEPLGISEAIWSTDPQGVTLGGGDLKLHPRDAAKLGYLWLNKGVWEGRQIVSRQWVESSVKPRIATDGGDHYGYGWWISTARGKGEFDSYRADGRGGQYVAVIPSLGILLGTTGGGFEIGEIAPLLLALADMHKPLPANPAGVARLQAAVATIARPPVPTGVAPLPATAQRISGKTFALEPNALGIETMRLVFGRTAEAMVSFRLLGDGGVPSWPVGLDGVYRMSAGEHDLPLGLRGSWVDAQTFVLEYDGIASNDHVFLRMTFSGERVVIEAREAGRGERATFTGRTVRP